jgi:cephalosporin hydroxylase
MITGRTEYKGYTAQQHDNFYGVFHKFISDIRPSQILEIGTAGGGFILAIRDILNEIGLNNVPIKSFDVVDTPFYNSLRSHDIEINIENLFDHSYTNLIKPEKIVPYIQRDGTTIVFCDGGHKIGEFNAIAPHIKSGDFILAHDYAENYQVYKEKIEGKIWGWLEIADPDIRQACIDNNISIYEKDTFENIVWTCRRKI